jgi:ATP-dependent Clp protease protease subunit
MIHQPLGQSSGQVSDVLIRTELLVRTRQMLNELLANNTGRSIEEIARDTERDNFMTAQQALEYGLIDRIIEHH